MRVLLAVVAVIFVLSLTVRDGDHRPARDCDPAGQASCPGPAVPNLSTLSSLRVGATR